MPKAGKDAMRATARVRSLGKESVSRVSRNPAARSLAATSMNAKLRKPQPENLIRFSIFRPQVLAGERLALWTSPFALQSRQQSSHIIPEHELNKLYRTILEAIEPETKKNYGAGLLCFHQFCDQMKTPEANRMPALELLVAAFVAHWAGKVAHMTIDNWLAGLSFWHTANGAPWLGGRILKAICTAATKKQPKPKPKQPPVTIEHMHALRWGLLLTDAFDAAVYVVACTAFWGCRQLGELAISSPGAYDTKKHVSRDASVAFRQIQGSANYAVFHIPWSKTTKAEGADVVLTEIEGEPTSPVIALKHHLNSNARIPGAAPLFSFETSNGCWAPMTRTWFLERCNEVWAAAGLGELSGHCFRIGGATELLLRGTHPDVVATIGSWKSRAFLDYWRKIEAIIPLFVSQTFDKSRLNSVARTMKDYRKKYR